jgi:ATP-dependent helicase/nuclease subunit B
MGIKRKFIGWDKPLLELALANFAKERNGESSPIDLEKTLILLPSGEAGRALLNGLAGLASENSSYLLPPKILTIEPFLLFGSDPFKIAPRELSVAGWTNILQTIDFANFANLFPQASAKKDFNWAYKNACVFYSLRRALGEGGHSIKDISGREDIEERERWLELAEIERRYLQLIKEQELEDAENIKLQSFAPKTFKKFERLIVLAVPDLPKVVCDKISSLPAGPSVELWINAPAEKENDFDEWGRPLFRSWKDAVLPLQNSSIRAADNPEEQCLSCLQALSEKQVESSANFATGMLNGDLIPVFKMFMEKNGAKIYDPSGEKTVKSGLCVLISALNDFLSDASFASIEKLIRIPDFFRFIIPDNTDIETAINAVDDFKSKYLPHSVKHAKNLLERAKKNGGAKDSKILGEIFAGFEKTHDDFENSESASSFLSSLISKSYKSRKFIQSDMEDARFLQAAEKLSEILFECSSERFKSLSPDKLQEFALIERFFREGTIYPNRPENSIEISGWLELAWKKEPKLFLIGMNEGFVPGSITGDMFLPDSLRQKIGLRTNEERFARDAFIFAGLLNSRRPDDVCVIVGRENVDGKLLKPSRLLFLCDETDFVKRAAAVFCELGRSGISVPPNPGPLWKLKADFSLSVSSLRVTAFRDYLECPFRFYLKHVLMFDEGDYEKTEIDAMEFGNILHDTMKILRKYPDSKDESELKKLLIGEFDMIFADKYGQQLSISLMYQKRSLEMRLAKAAEKEAESRSDGWETLDIEYEIGGYEGVVFNGMKIKGRIDRIDYNRHLKTLRIIDYKSSERAKSPESEHWTSKLKKWRDLQLPLYKILIQKENYAAKNGISECENVVCSYFNLPKAVTETGIKDWNNMDLQLPGATAKIEEIISAIQNKIFWPPAEKVKYEISKRLFPYPVNSCACPPEKDGVY